ncbi:MAG: pantoate--beta-alanine ligase [Planctomycetes bacterium]|nr:pantoate--beta-alanine ligase [Planctomycetota bacterium]
MSAPVRAFVALGGNLGDRRARLEAALAGLSTTPGVRVAAVSAAYENPPVGGPPQPPYWNAVAELRTTRSAHELHARLHTLEAEAGRVRAVKDGPRTLDLDLLAFGDEVVARPDLRVPHPRALERAFVLAPWADVAPDAVVGGATVLTHAARLRARAPAAFDALVRAALLAVPGVAAPRRPVVLGDAAALAAWRAAVAGTVGFVPTMGALHEGHAALARRARAECDATLVSIFVNPTQFGPNEDFARYPRTLEADLDLLARVGVDAVYAPSVEDLYPTGSSTRVEVAGPSGGYEGAARPGHFSGVATVVAKLLLRARPDRAYFGRKDAQQVAVVRRLHRDLDLPGRVVVAPTVRDVDGLALSSRNRYLSADERARALALPRALGAARAAAAAGERRVSALVGVAGSVLAQAPGVVPSYVDVVDPDAFAPLAELGEAPALMVATVKVGTTRLLDNEWMTVGDGTGPA